MSLTRNEIAKAYRSDTTNIPRLKQSNEKIEALELELEEEKGKAMERGRSESTRIQIAADLWNLGDFVMGN